MPNTRIKLKKILKANLIKHIKTITNSQYLDIIGLVIVVTASISLGYHKTEIPFTFKGKNYVFMLGIVSIINTCLSMISTRLVTKKVNFGNFIGTFNTALSGAIDFLLGNVGAVLTYPISFLGNYFVFKSWKKSTVLNAIDFRFFRNMILGLLLSFVLNFIAFYFLSDNAINWKLFFAIAIPAGISFGATFNTALLYPDNWFIWQLYNVFKVIQNLMQGNIANVGKYMFYFINAIFGYITWNDDRKNQDDSKK